MVVRKGCIRDTRELQARAHIPDTSSGLCACVQL